MTQTQEHHFCHYSQWKDQKNVVWKMVGESTRWKASRWRHLQVSELLCMEEYKQVVMDFLASTEVGRFPPEWMVSDVKRTNGGDGGHSSFVSCCLENEINLSVDSFFCSWFSGNELLWVGALPSNQFTQKRRCFRFGHTPVWVNAVLIIHYKQCRESSRLWLRLSSPSRFSSVLSNTPYSSSIAVKTPNIKTGIG